MSEVKIAMNDALDTKALAKHYKEHGWVKIDQILSEEAAEAVFKSIFEDVAWFVVMPRPGDGVRQWFTGNDMQNMPRRQQTALLQDVYKMGQTGFSYSHHAYPMKESREQKWKIDILLQRFFDFLEEDALADLIKAITGKVEKSDVSAEAVWFRRDHFRSKHSDKTISDKASVGFHFDFTKEWNDDWGGLNLIFDGDGKLETALAPSFNSLTIYNPEKMRSHSYQASFATGFNLGVIGYFNA